MDLMYNTRSIGIAEVELALACAVMCLVAVPDTACRPHPGC